MTTAHIDDIDRQTQRYAAARGVLGELMQALRDEQDAIKRRMLQRLRNAVARLRTEHADLLALIAAHPELFDKPRTRVFHGVRVGWMKERGKLDIADVAMTVKALRKLLGGDADVYIKTTEAPIRSALANLPAKDLQRIGVAVTDDTDTPFIKAADGEIEKLIDALLGDIDEVAP